MQSLLLVSYGYSELCNSHPKKFVGFSFLDFFLPVDMKNGIRKRPESTRSRKAGNVAASKGNAPQTRT